MFLERQVHIQKSTIHLAKLPDESFYTRSKIKLQHNPLVGTIFRRICHQGSLPKISYGSTCQNIDNQLSFWCQTFPNLSNLQIIDCAIFFSGDKISILWHVLTKLCVCILQFSHHRNIATYYGAFVKKGLPGQEDQLWVC